MSHDKNKSASGSTTGAGAPAVSDRNSLSIGPNGPLLLHDVHFLEQMAHFNREKVPERQPHAKGAGAFGVLQVTEDVSRYTRAALFRKGAKTDMLARFSTVAGESGSPDTWRDVRGFSLKFYTSEGNYDLVGNNTPVFFLRDPRKFADLNKAVKRDPHTNLRSARNNWDFWTLLPEALMQVTVVMSDRGIPRTFRHMHGFGSHTYSFTNAGGERFWVKFHFHSQQGIEALTDAQAEVLAGKDRESHGRDLFQAIERGDFPKWKLFVQVMPELDAETYRFHPFDLTKVWPKSDYPLIEVGEFELNRNPENWYQDVEQSAFAPSNLVPGIGPSPDKMLQARLFAYSDAQRYRLGVNHHQIPVNAARCPVHSNHRDGAMRVDGNYGGLPHYEPNSYGQWQEQPQYREPPLRIRGDADFWNFREDDSDYFSQPGALFRSYDPAQQQRLFDNTARALGDAPDFIKQRHVDNCSKADPAYGAGVAAALQKLAESGPSDPFVPARPEAGFPKATPGAEDIVL